MEWNSYAVATFALVASLLLSPSHQQQQGGTQSNKCIEDFSNTLLGCVGEAGLTNGNFLWFVTNGTSSRSEAPADEAGFKTKICGVQQQVGGCTFQRVATVVNSTACVGTSRQTNQQEVIRTQLSTIFGTYDAKCMHPCRKTLAIDLRECYTESGLDPQLFLSNSTQGAVVGNSEEQVKMFCDAKDNLITCMQNKVNNCPEAPQILRAIDLDIPSFSKGVGVLCKHPKVYLHGLSCFAETTNDVDKCQQREAQSLIQLNQQASAGNWSEDRFFSSFCDIAIKQIDCDSMAWKNKNHEACIPAVVGLRRELECELIAPQCNVNPKQIDQLDHACHPEKFETDTRKKCCGGDASSIVISAVLMVASLTMSSLILN